MIIPFVGFKFVGYLFIEIDGRYTSTNSVRIQITTGIKKDLEFLNVLECEVMC